MNKALLALFAILLCQFATVAQSINYSDNVKISVLTCGTGDELYSQFGHSAFRVQDFDLKYDLVYNYGIFDFSDPNFYLNFAKGKLIYMLGISYYHDFYAQYHYENRFVKEQELQLTLKEKKALLAFLKHNAQPENAPYQYDFFFDNCSTKITEVLKKVLKSNIKFDDSYLEERFTFRELINHNVPHNSWANVGINIALGSVIDRKATAAEHMFLPQYTFDALAKASINGQPAINHTKELLRQDVNRKPSASLLSKLVSPYAIMSLIALIIVGYTYRDLKNNKRTKAIDIFLLLITGFLGVFIALLWFATNHTATVGNFNLFWAFLPNLIVLFKLKQGKWRSNYFLVLTLLMGVIALLWITGVELFAVGLIPLFIALTVRYLYLYIYFKKPQINA